tara:strand:- start:54 stop:254 length:201 start_codon:yes stop_codon:yes gene_type:complete
LYPKSFQAIAQPLVCQFCIQKSQRDFAGGAAAVSFVFKNPSGISRASAGGRGHRHLHQHDKVGLSA